MEALNCVAQCESPAQALPDAFRNPAQNVESKDGLKMRCKSVAVISGQTLSALGRKIFHP